MYIFYYVYMHICISSKEKYIRFESPSDAVALKCVGSTSTFPLAEELIFMATLFVIYCSPHLYHITLCDLLFSSSLSHHPLCSIVLIILDAQKRALFYTNRISL